MVRFVSNVACFNCNCSRDVTFRTFKNIILLDELYNVFKDYIEEIMIVFANYFKEDEAAFLNLVFDLINSLNHPELAGGGGGDSQQLTATSEIQVPTSEISVATQNERMDSVCTWLVWFV